jgi:hypothetical protein
MKLTAIDSGIEILLNEADGNRFRGIELFIAVGFSQLFFVMLMISRL